MSKKKDFDKGLIGAAAGGAIGAGAGIAGAGTVVATAGAGAAGAAGITSGLAALGGTMVGGITVVAATPVVAGVGLGALGYLAAKGIAKAVEDHPQTMGGKIWWIDLKNVNGWRLQKNKVSRHCRILNRNDVRQAYGSEEEMTKLFDSMPKR